MEIILMWLIGSILIAAVTCMLAKHFGIAYLAGMFVGTLMVAQAVVSKFVEIGPYVTSAGIVAYSITFLVSDTISEFWGKRVAKRVIWAGFLVYIMFVFTTQIAIHLPFPVFYEQQQAFIAIFNSTWRVALGSFIAYMIVQHHDVWAYHFWKKYTKGKYLWIRNNFSTGASQIIDTIIFFTIAFYGVIPLWQVIIDTIVLKIIIAIVDTPFMYLIRYYYLKVGKKWDHKQVSY